MESPLKPAFTLQMKVRDYEVDVEGIVNNAVYLHYFEHTRHEFCSMAGLSFRRMREMGMAPVASEISVRYIRPLGLGDTMTSMLSLTRRGPRFIFHQWIVNDRGQTVVDGTVTIVNVLHGRPTRGDEFAEAFGRFLTD